MRMDDLDISKVLFPLNNLVSTPPDGIDTLIKSKIHNALLITLLHFRTDLWEFYLDIKHKI